MIEKIERIDDSFIDKINELIDIVNELQTTLNNYTTRFRELDSENMKKIENGFINLHKETVDPYAEQEKLIGCVCRFWFDNPYDTTLDYLGEIKTGKNGIEYYGEETDDWFPHCEPVKPDDDIIYKGE